eukprot:UN07532
MTELSVKDKIILTTYGYPLNQKQIFNYLRTNCGNLDDEIMLLIFYVYDYDTYIFNVLKEKSNQEIATITTNYLNIRKFQPLIDRDSTIKTLHNIKPKNHGKRWSSDDIHELENYLSNSDNPTEPNAIKFKRFAKKMERTPGAIENRISKLRAKHSRCRSKNILRYKYWSLEEHYELIQHINANSDKPTKEHIEFYANKFKR